MYNTGDGEQRTTNWLPYNRNTSKHTWVSQDWVVPAKSPAPCSLILCHCLAVCGTWCSTLRHLGGICAINKKLKGTILRSQLQKTTWKGWKTGEKYPMLWPFFFTFKEVWYWKYHESLGHASFLWREAGFQPEDTASDSPSPCICSIKNYPMDKSWS